MEKKKMTKVKYWCSVPGLNQMYKKHKADAGFDLCAAGEVVLRPNEPVLVPTGLHVGIPEGWVGIVKSRSGLASKGIQVDAGVVDSGYTGEVKVLLQLVTGDQDRTERVVAGVRIAQLVVVPCLLEAEAVEGPEDLGDTERGASGFGSTGGMDSIPGV